jgi:cytochrome b pre-mRNA-processing protein 3
MVCAVLATVMLRLERTGLVRESVLLTELFVHDMDGQLREFGIGDMVVGKHIGKLVGAMGGRLDGYRAGFAGDDGALAEAIARNVTFGAEPHAAVVAAGLRTLADRLARTGDEALLAGEFAA